MSSGDSWYATGEENGNGNIGQGEADFPAPPPSTEDRIGADTKFNRGRVTTIALAAGTVLVLIIVLSVTLSGGGGGAGNAQSLGGSDKGSVGNVPTSPGSPSTIPPTRAPTFPATLRPTQEHYAKLYEIISGVAGPTEKELLDTPGSPQEDAFLWLELDYLPSMTHEQLIQRYILAVLYFSTYGIPSAYTDENFVWNVTTGWLTGQDECLWYGVGCNDIKEVTTIQLRNNRLSGKIPRELQHLRSLQVLDISKNAINQIGGQTTLFGRFTSLVVFSAEDNYIDYVGIPIAFTKLTNLVSLEIGLNLLEGPIDTAIFQKLTNLVYFDAHSNYLTGKIPASLQRMTALEQLRLQYNALSDDMSWVRSGGIPPAIKTIWLDDNNIDSILPMRLGNFTTLESLSLPNTGIKGLIPTQIGYLTSMRELWLEGNKLRGTIPTEIGMMNNLSTCGFMR